MAVIDRIRSSRRTIIMAAVNLSGVRLDILFALRLLRKRKAFSLAIILTLALGVGANAVVFSIFYGVLLSPLPFSDPGHLFLLRGQSAQTGGVRQYSYPDLQDVKRSSRSLAGIVAWRNATANLTGVREPIHIRTRQASAGLFRVLGVPLSLGREFTEDEDRPGATPVAIVSHEVWQRHFPGRPHLLGEHVVLDGKSHGIVGVLPPRFDLFGEAAVYTPLGQYDAVSMRQRQFQPGLWVVVRLAGNVSVAQAQAELSGISQQLAESYPATNKNWEFTIVSLRDSIVGDVRGMLLLLQGAVWLLFLIASANVANLYLARSAEREDELSVRMALGATSGHVLRLVLTESVIVSLVGGIVGLGVVALTTAYIQRAALMVKVPRLEHVTIGAPVFVFTLLASVLAGIAFGLLVAFRHRRVGAPALAGLRSTRAGLRHMQLGLVATQVALSFVLLAGTGLMGRTMSRLLSVDMGFDSRNVLTAAVGLSPAVRSEPARIRTTWREILDRARQLPGVEVAALNIGVPLRGEESVRYSSALTEASNTPVRSARAGTPTKDYWKAMRIPLLRGRLFTESDTANSPLVVVIDEHLAWAAFGDADPIGQFLNLRLFGQARVVGVVRHIRYAMLDEDATGRSLEQIYLPFEQLPDALLRPLSPGIRLVLRTSIPPHGVEPSLRQIVVGTGLDEPPHDVATMDDIVRESLFQRRLLLQLIGTFGMLALILASVGIAGVVSHTMNSRLREIGILVALGAQPRQILGLALHQGLTIVLVGLATGFLVWLGVRGIVRSWLYQIATTDPFTLGAVAVMLVGVALIASHLAASRALRVDPAEVLRSN
jgi:putative ABC transport system permease protein